MNISVIEIKCIKDKKKLDKLISNKYIIIYGLRPFLIVLHEGDINLLELRSNWKYKQNRKSSKNGFIVETLLAMKLRKKNFIFFVFIKCVILKNVKKKKNKEFIYL